jgi:cytochrome c556
VLGFAPRFVMNNPLLALSVLVLTALQTASQGPVEALMKAKAGYAHRLLDAVVRGELETVRDQAFRLKAVAETADWNVIDTPEYVRESEAFIRATDRLLQSAGSKNHEAVALAYVEITLSCVHCHRYVNANR